MHQCISDEWVMKADEASSCLQALSSDCWSINGAVLYLRDKLENTAFGANMLMRIITVSSELSRKQKDAQMVKTHLQPHTPCSCWIWVTTARARIEVDISLFPKWPCGNIRASPTQIKHTAGGAAKGNSVAQENWNKITRITTSRQETASGLLGHFHERLCHGDGRRETGSVPLNSCNTIRVSHPSMRFSKAAHWFPSWISSYSSDPVIFSIHSAPCSGLCISVFAAKYWIRTETIWRQHFCISPFLNRPIDVKSLRSPAQVQF